MKATLARHIPLSLMKQDLKVLNLRSMPLEDITLGNGITYFEKDEAIMTLKTDKEGKAISDALLVGKYYLKETIVPDGFVQNNEVYAFEIKDEDIQGVNVDMDVF